MAEQRRERLASSDTYFSSAWFSLLILVSIRAAPFVDHSVVTSGQCVLKNLLIAKGFPGGSVGKESTCNAGDEGDMG